MKRTGLLIVLAIAIYSCEGGGSSDGCTHKEHTVYTGEKGGCY